MPELPEVEIARRQLMRWAAGRTIDAVRVLDPAAIRHKRSTLPRDAHPDGVRALTDAVEGRVADEPIRLGKRLGWTFGGPGGVHIHLGMTGQWVRRPAGDPPPRFSKLGLVVGEHCLWFLDSRRFGCVVPSVDVRAELAEGLGPDGWLDPLTGAELQQRLSGKRAVKVALLDQAVIAGIGNIQAVESLFRAGIDPHRRCDALALDECERLAEAIPAQLGHTIATQDTDEFVYLTQGGDNPFVVYGRSGEPCPRCGTPIASDRLGGRVTTWCPSCQS